MRYLDDVQRLIAYLRENVILDFQGDLSIEKVKELLGNDDARDTRALLTKLTRDKGVDQMLLVVADCLLDHVQRSLGDDVIREQLRTYIES